MKINYVLVVFWAIVIFALVCVAISGLIEIIKFGFKPNVGPLFLLGSFVFAGYGMYFPLKEINDD